MPERIEEQRSFCLIYAVGAKSVFGRTSDNELVVMRRDANSLRDVQITDVVSFAPRPFHTKATYEVTPARTAKWFGSWPEIIARGCAPISRKHRTTGTGDEWADYLSADGGEEPLTRTGEV